jgi:hypothetical protein
MTKTMYDRRKGRVALALQEDDRRARAQDPASLVVEPALQTHALLCELGNPNGACITPTAETEREREKGRMRHEMTNEWLMWCGCRER